MYDILFNNLTYTWKIYNMGENLMYKIALHIINAGFIEMLKYVPEFFLGALFPALLLSGALNVFTTKKHIKYLFGGGMFSPFAYLIAVFIGIVFSGCACGVLPLFTALLEAGSTFGIAITFLFAGPTINMMAVVLTGQMFSWSLGLYRILFTIAWALFIGFSMQLIFKENADQKTTDEHNESIELLTTSPFKLTGMICFLLILLTLESHNAFTVKMKLYIWAGWLLFFIPFLKICFDLEQIKTWLSKTMHFTKKIIIPLIIGIFLIGAFKDIQNKYFLATFSRYLGNDGWGANFISSFLAALMYFGTCISVLIVKFFENSGMANGPMISIFLAGPAISFPSMLAMYRIMKFKRTVTYIVFVIAAGTISGYLYGNFIVEKDVSSRFVFSYDSSKKLAVLDAYQKVDTSLNGENKKFETIINKTGISELVNYVRTKTEKLDKYSVTISNSFDKKELLIKLLTEKKIKFTIKKE